MAELAPLVSVDWLASAHEGCTVIDCTWAMSDADYAALPRGYIPGAVEFDLGAIKALPLDKQTEGVIAAQLSKLGVCDLDVIVVYDRHGMFSAPRLWWLLKTLGHTNVAVLNGGLPAWIAAGHAIEDAPATRTETQYREKTSLLCGSDMADTIKAIGTDVQIVDARAPGRFKGDTPEPREGLRSGRIPSAVNLPFGALRDNGKFKSKAELLRAIRAAGIDMNRPIITSCGSGVTAAGLAFIFAHLGKKDVSVYTGSWAEYGASDAPLEVG